MSLNFYRKKSGSRPNFDGFYSSTKGFEKYDQSSYCYLIKFYENGTVEKGVPHEGDFYKVGAGTYSQSGSEVICKIRSDADGFESKWIGHLHDDFIQFEIEQPDFEDIVGRYTFVPSKST
ncbi:hypothetical protein ACJJIF_06310 [Microbulbifer sp. SSSA002]|uniref:hypothetical protein n=1 Tax=Microbulbifer sp. SSSA002 TaxID=3243376 RepID=UPI00403A5E8C